MASSINILSTRFYSALAFASVIELIAVQTPTNAIESTSIPYYSFSAFGLQNGCDQENTSKQEFFDMCEQSENFKKLDQIANMKENWNGYGAEPFQQCLIDRIRTLLISLPVQPEIFPTARNSIQLEYDVGENHIEIEVYDDDQVGVLTMKGLDNITEGTLKYSEDRIREVVDRFYAGISA